MMGISLCALNPHWHLTCACHSMLGSQKVSSLSLCLLASRVGISSSSSPKLCFVSGCSWEGVSCSSPCSNSPLLSIRVGSWPFLQERGCFVLHLLHQQLIFAFVMRWRQFPTPLPDTGRFGFYLSPEAIDLCLYPQEDKGPSLVTYCFCFNDSISGKVSGACAYSQAAITPGGTLSPLR